VEARGPREPEGLPEEGDVEREPRLRGPWWFGGRRRLSEEQREQLLSQLYFEGPDRGPFLRRFSTLLALSVLIAVFGLAEDSAPVVIGAMLISPLATPLLALSAALVMGWPRRQLESLAIVVGGTIGALALAWVALWALPEPQSVTIASGELLARTEPRLLDLGIAIVAGAAGAYVLIRREAIGALPGVAIAVALVPPVATAGMLFELDRPALAEQALLLYATNVAGIVLAGSLVLLLAGMRPETVRGRLTRRIRLGVLAATLTVLAVAYPLGAETADRVSNAGDRDEAMRIAGEWIEGRGLELAGVDVEGESVRLQLTGPRPPPPLESLADRLAAGLEKDVELTVNWTPRRSFEATGSA
jgi:uncharacterized hydrophobic protein (TIGR00271 family)